MLGKKHVSGWNIGKSHIKRPSSIERHEKNNDSFQRDRRPCLFIWVGYWKQSWPRRNACYNILFIRNLFHYLSHDDEESWHKLIYPINRYLLTWFNMCQKYSLIIFAPLSLSFSLIGWSRWRFFRRWVSSNEIRSSIEEYYQLWTTENNFMTWIIRLKKTWSCYICPWTFEN